MAINMNPNYDHLFKLLLIGDVSVGKRSMLMKFPNDGDKVNDENADFKVRTCDINGQVIKLQLWGTGGQERYRTVTETHYRGSDGILVVFDLTNRVSFDNVSSWIGEVESYASGGVKCVLVGNKCDLKDDRQVSEEEAKELIKDRDCCIAYVETSVVTGANLDELYEGLAKSILNKLVTIVYVSGELCEGV